MVLIGRTDERGPAARFGRYRAADGSPGAAVDLDLDRPHVALVVGKRGAGKSYTLGVLAEALAESEGVAPVVADPMGAFRTLREPPVRATVRAPDVPPAAIAPRAWCRMLSLDPEGRVGALVWRAAEATDTLEGMAAFVDEADVPEATRRAATNHLALAESWDVFDADGPDTAALADRPTVVDLAGVERAPAAAALAAVADLCYEARLAGDIDVMPWLLLDEAHAFVEGVAWRALRRLLTRGRHPGVGLVLATQRPGALPGVASSQADLVVAHRLTDRADRAALADVRPAYVEGTLLERLPTEPGDALVVDDATESLHAIRVRERATTHGGETARASDGDPPPDGTTDGPTETQV
jgi:hypothetical protein